MFSFIEKNRIKFAVLAQLQLRSSKPSVFQPARAGCYWQTVPSQWEGGRLFDGSAKFFYGNSCNSGTESRKMVSKVGN